MRSELFVVYRLNNIKSFRHLFIVTVGLESCGDGHVHNVCQDSYEIGKKP